MHWQKMIRTNCCRWSWLPKMRFFGRSQELMQSCDGRAEWRAMEDALVELRALQVEKLNFPE